MQAWFPDEHAETTPDAYETVTCTACSKVHLVNPKTGKTLGASDD